MQKFKNIKNEWCMQPRLGPVLWNVGIAQSWPLVHLNIDKIHMLKVWINQDFYFDGVLCLWIVKDSKMVAQIQINVFIFERKLGYLSLCGFQRTRTPTLDAGGLSLVLPYKFTPIRVH